VAGGSGAGARLDAVVARRRRSTLEGEASTGTLRSGPRGWRDEWTTGRRRPAGPVVAEVGWAGVGPHPNDPDRIPAAMLFGWPLARNSTAPRPARAGSASAGLGTTSSRSGSPAITPLSLAPPRNVDAQPVSPRRVVATGLFFF